MGGRDRRVSGGKNLGIINGSAIGARYIGVVASVRRYVHRSAYRDLYTRSNLITRYVAWIIRRLNLAAHKYRRR